MNISPTEYLGRPNVSVIIPARNSARTLGICLDSIRRQSCPEIEIIVVDGASRDESPNICANFGARFVSVSYDAERTTKKNLGAKMGVGKYLFFVDADFELQPNVVRECVDLCESGAGAIIVPEIVRAGLGFWSKCRELESIMNIGDDLVQTTRFMIKEAFIDVGGFDENLVFGEDNEIGNKLREKGMDIPRCESCIIHHDGPTSTMILHKFYYGRTAIRYLAKRKSTALRQFSFVRIGWMRNSGMLKRYPTYCAGLMFLQWAKYSAAFLGVVVGAFDNVIPS